MKCLLPLSHTYLQVSNQVLEKLTALSQLLPNAITADAVSMYINIDIQYAIQVLKCWFTNFLNEIQPNFPIKPFLKTLKLIMTQNVFQFDNLYYLQIKGTAMGMSTVYMHVCYTTLYTAWMNCDTANLQMYPTFFQAICWSGPVHWLNGHNSKTTSMLLENFDRQYQTLDEKAIFLDLNLSFNSKDASSQVLMRNQWISSCIYCWCQRILQEC